MMYIMLIGYARVSTHEQNLTPQTDALKKAGCQKIFDDRVSGAGSERPGLEAALEYVRERDTLLVWRLDRLGCSLKDLIEIIGGLEKRGVGFKSLQESIDATTSGGRLIFHVFGALAELEGLKRPFVLGNLPEEEYRTERDRLRAKLATLTPPVMPDLERAAELLEDFRTIWDVARPREQKQIVRTLLNAVYLDSGDIGPVVAVEPRPEYAPLFDLVRKTGPENTSGPVGKMSQAGATGFEPAISGLTGRHVNRYTTPPVWAE
jgi:hypothetical protein